MDIYSIGHNYMPYHLEELYYDMTGKFSSSDITSKRKARHVHTLMINLVCLFNHLSTSISMSRREHIHNQNLPVTAQNKLFTFVDGLAPNKLCLSATNTHQFTSQEIQNIQWHCEAQQLTQVREKKDLVATKEELYVKQLRVVCLLPTHPLQYQRPHPFCSNFPDALVSQT